MASAIDPQTLLNTSFTKPTALGYWHYAMKNQPNPAAYTAEKVAKQIATIVASTKKEHSFEVESTHDWTPMHVAALAGNKAGLIFLRSQGLLADKPDADGRTAIDYCREYHPELLPALGIDAAPAPRSIRNILSSFLEARRIPLPPTPFFYQANSNDFGLQIEELLFTMPNNDSDEMKESFQSTGLKIEHFVHNLKSLSKTLGFRLKLASYQYVVRDHWIRLSNGQFVIPSDSRHIKAAIERSSSLSLVQQDKASFLTTHEYFWGTMGATDAHAERAIPDFHSILGAAPATRFYIEGGNYYLASTKGRKHLILGQDLLYIALNQLRLDKCFDDPMIDCQGATKRIARTLTRKKVEETLAEMYPQGLLKPSSGCKKGFLSSDEVSKVTWDLFLTAKAEKPLASRECAEKLGYFQPLALTVAQIDASFPLVAKYLAQKEITHSLIAMTFGVPEKDLMFIPQVDYHLDVFMRPGPKGSFFVLDYQCVYDLLLTIQEAANELDLSSQDLHILNRYLHTAKMLSQQLAPLITSVHQKLQAAGFVVIPTPGLFYDVTPSILSPRDPDLAITYNLNFLNAITGYSPTTKRYYYLAGGAQVGDRLGNILMEAYRAFLEVHEQAIDVHFIGHDPENPTDFSENMRWQNRQGAQAGPHCFSVELKTKPHIG